MNDKNKITINGRQLTFTPGETILEVATRNGIFIPTLCHLKGTTPTGACRVCVCEVEGARALMAACTVPAAPNMVVHTASQKVLTARRTVLELLLAAGNHNCAIRKEDGGRWTRLQEEAAEYDQSEELCEVYGACKLQALCYRYQVYTGPLAGRGTDYPLEDASPLILRDFSRCILCGRCVQACHLSQVNNAISLGFRGAKAKIVAMGDKTLAESACVYCGECLQVCPVGALVEKRSRYKIRPWEATRVRTTCGYCGVGCQMELQVKDGAIMKVEGIEDGAPNEGRLCAKGRFGFDYLGSPHRLTKPLVRTGAKLKETSWDEALDLVAGKLKAIKEKNGGAAVAGIASARSTNESLYLFQKLFRDAVGSGNLAAPFESAPMTHGIDHIEKAACIVLVGSDVTHENPVAGAAIKRATIRENPAKLIVIDSRDTVIAGHADQFLKVAEGSESVLLNGVIHGLIEKGLGQESLPADQLADAKKTLAELTPAKAAEGSGISAETAAATIETLATAAAEGPVMLLYGPKVAAWVPVFRLLIEILGSLDRDGGGVNALGDMCNSVGALLMGVHPHYRPGYEPAGADAGLSLPEIVAAAGGTGGGAGAGTSGGNGAPQGAASKIEMLYVAGENLAITEPGLEGVRQALKGDTFLVVQDSFENETTALADVVLPAAAWAEDEGTFTSAERRVSRTRRAVDAPGEARSERWIYGQLAARLGASWANPEQSAQELWDSEIAQTIPQLRGISYAGIEHNGLQWPTANGNRIATAEAPVFKPQWQSFNYQHRQLMEQCEGLLEALARPQESVAQTSAMDPEKIRADFDAFLKAEEVTEKKPPIDAVLAEYRSHRGGLIPVLQRVQGILGFLPIEAQNYIALGLDVPASDVYGVVSFYAFFTMTPRGKHVVRVCLGTACYVKEAGKILANIEEHFGIKVGQTTEDRQFTIEGVRCVGACGLAPVVVVGEETLGMVDPAQAVKRVEAFRD